MAAMAPDAAALGVPLIKPRVWDVAAVTETLEPQLKRLQDAGIENAVDDEKGNRFDAGTTAGAALATARALQLPSSFPVPSLAVLFSNTDRHAAPRPSRRRG